jgi:hypothetical protein
MNVLCALHNWKIRVRGQRRIAANGTIAFVESFNGLYDKEEKVNR